MTSAALALPERTRLQAVSMSLFRYLPLVLLAIGWELTARFVFASSSALPSLSQVAAAWIELVKDGDLITHGAS